MAKRATIAILRTDADVELATSLRRILEGFHNDQVGQLRIEELSFDRCESLSDICHHSRFNLTILIESAEAQLFMKAIAVEPKRVCLSCPLLAILPENLASEALRILEAGASDFLIPPIRPSDLIPRVLHLLRPSGSEDDLISLLKHKAGTKQIVGQSPLLLAQLRKLPLIAGCDATVLICGETGTGKELCARAIHYLSRRSNKPFVPVDCGAIPTELIENELFGHEQGAYTTASRAQSGLLRESEGGTLFLDEIDALSSPMQSKLLRFLQEKEYRTLGSPKTYRADVRVIAASNISLEDAVRAGRFRQDLYYRVNVLPLILPPLRDRREDIPLLAQHFVEKYTLNFARPVRCITAEAFKRLLNYPWPGNARELENIIERAVLLCEGPAIEARDLELPRLESENAGFSYQARKAIMVNKWELDELRRMLSTNCGNVSAIARAEGKDPSAIRALLRKHHLRALHESPYWHITT